MPAAIPILIGITAAGTAVSTIGQIKGAHAAEAAGNYNQAIADQEAQDALDRGTVSEERYRQGVKGLIGSQRAGFAGQGVDVGGGSAVDVQADAAFLGELDALQIRQNAMREAWGYRVQGQQAKMQGDAQQSAGYFGAASTVLGGTSSILATKYGWGAGAKPTNNAGLIYGPGF